MSLLWQCVICISLLIYIVEINKYYSQKSNTFNKKLTYLKKICVFNAYIIFKFHKTKFSAKAFSANNLHNIMCLRIMCKRVQSKL